MCSSGLLDPLCGIFYLENWICPLTQMPLGMDMSPLRAVLLLLCCSGYWCHDCNTTRVYFVTSNFHSVLHWDEVDIPGQNILYSVEYKQYGNSWSRMMDCQNISVASCDLSSVITNIYSRYYGKVMVNDACFMEYLDFIPAQQTTLGAPEVSVSTTESSFTVNITTPMGPQNRSFKEISKDGSWKPHINYEVHLTHPQSKATQGFHNVSGLITVSNLDANTEYCGTALYLWTHPYMPRKSENTTFCVTLPAKSCLQFIMLGLMALFLLIVLALVLCQLYITQKRRPPKVLIVQKSNTPPYHLDPKLEISHVKICSESTCKIDKPESALLSDLDRSKVVSNEGSYAAQDCHDLSWRCHSYTNQQVASAENHMQRNDSTTSYSLVLTEPRSMDREVSCDSGVGDSFSNEAPGLPVSLCTRGSCDPFQDFGNVQLAQDLDEETPDSEVLVLPVLRSENGKLEFSSLTFQPEPLSTLGLLTNSSELTPQIKPAGERTPLLTDLEWSKQELAKEDYAKAYFQNYIQQNPPELPTTNEIPMMSLPDCTSSYRQNWVPLECHFTDSGVTTEEEENNRVEPLPMLESIFLDGWAVQIQG